MSKIILFKDTGSLKRSFWRQFFRGKISAIPGGKPRLSGIAGKTDEALPDQKFLKGPERLTPK